MQTHRSGVPCQVRECATALLHVAKREKVPIFLIGHVTKASCLSALSSSA